MFGLQNDYTTGPGYLNACWRPDQRRQPPRVAEGDLGDVEDDARAACGHQGQQAAGQGASRRQVEPALATLSRRISAGTRTSFLRVIGLPPSQ